MARKPDDNIDSNAPAAFDPEAAYARMMDCADDLVRHLANMLKAGPMHDAEAIMNHEVPAYGKQSFKLRELMLYEVTSDLSLVMRFLAPMLSADWNAIKKALRSHGMAMEIDEKDRAVVVKLAGLPNELRDSTRIKVRKACEAAKVKIRHIRRDCIKAGADKAEIQDLTDKACTHVDGLMQASLTTVACM